VGFRTGKLVFVDRTGLIREWQSGFRGQWTVGQHFSVELNSEILTSAKVESHRVTLATSSRLLRFGQDWKPIFITSLSTPIQRIIAIGNDNIALLSVEGQITIVKDIRLQPHSETEISPSEEFISECVQDLINSPSFKISSELHSGSYNSSEERIVKVKQVVREPRHVCKESPNFGTFPVPSEKMIFAAKRLEAALQRID
jgi:hypothetical protein